MRLLSATLFLAAAVCVAQVTLTITTTSLPTGTVGTPYAATLQVTGGNPFTPYQWSLSGALPPGLGMSSSGQISGTPTAAGSFSFDVWVNLLVSRRLTLTVLDVGSGSKPAITIGSLTVATAGVAYSETLRATGGRGGYQWTLVAGALPAGLTLDRTAGTIAGMPTTAGSSAFSLQVTDSAGQQSAAIAFTLLVSPPPLTITTVSPLFNGVSGVSYAQTFSASGGVRPYTWSIVSGAPAGLRLDAASGVLQGTPSSAGTFTFVVQVADAVNTLATGSYSITVNSPALTATLASQPAPGMVGVPYNQKLAFVATGGTAPITWSLLSGGVPGLIFDGATLTLAGTPTSAGAFNMTILARDANGLTASRTVSVVIAPAGLTITTDRQLPGVELTGSYFQELAVSGGAPPYTWSATGLPAGLRIDSATGVISGIAAAGGNFSAVIGVRDSALAIAQDLFTIAVRMPAAPSVQLTGLPGTLDPREQVALDLSISAPYPAPITGTALLTFLPESGLPDRTVVFAAGGSSVDFTIPAGTTTPEFDSPLMLQTGTVAGTIMLSVSLRAGGTDITPSPAPSLSAQIARAAPVITDVRVSRSDGNLALIVSGYSTAREVTQATVEFAAAGNQTLQPASSSLTIGVESLFSAWFQQPANSVYGSQFVFTQPFTVQGDSSAVLPRSVTLTNRAGSTTFRLP